MQTTNQRGSDENVVNVPVYILAGGKSARYGTDKARVLIENVPLLVRIADTFRAVTDEITVVAAADHSYADMGFRTIGDAVHSRGPIGGLLRALEDVSGEKWIFLTACDWIGIRQDWLLTLLAKRDEIGDRAEAIIYRSDRLEPLLGLYHSAIRRVVSQQIGRNQLRMSDLLARIETIDMPAPTGWDGVINLNRPSDFRKLM